MSLYLYLILKYLYEWHLDYFLSSGPIRGYSEGLWLYNIIAIRVEAENTRLEAKARGLDFPLFQSKTKIYETGKVKFKNDPKRVCPTIIASYFIVTIVLRCHK